ncbi:hypothetical protein PR202_ga26399 [Eleusine coracana subsp. coracana]|uniref:Uncharacterized protein n=1 Tax=Eleusine coracana subsp. coracana TaxID=191504 RepID=A0AAV5DDM8_ELECO|nr:hypothetical protein PR202_ga26399 [Eleusine coracana subsp. coracana]
MVICIAFAAAEDTEQLPESFDVLQQPKNNARLSGCFIPCYASCFRAGFTRDYCDDFCQRECGDEAQKHWSRLWP